MRSRTSFLVIGSKGQVGWELCRTLAPLGDVTGLDLPDIDVTDPSSLRDALDRVRPTHILNAAAWTAVDKAEDPGHQKLCRALNTEAPALLAQEARDRSSLLIHYSTEYVYDGSGDRPWVETDEPAPLGFYGQSKLEGDLAIESSGCDHLIFRLQWIYGLRGANFLLTMRRLFRERETLSVVDDQIGAPTWCRHVAEATALVIARRDQQTGIYHLASSGYTSWHGFAQAIFDLDPIHADRKVGAIRPIPTADYPTPARRPLNSRVSTDKLHRDFGIRLPDWRTALSQVLEP